jgi:hypothetical protein
MRWSVRAAAALAAVACTVKSDPIECTSSSVCDLSIVGQCVQSASGRRWCQYSDVSCTGGFRWSPQAGDGLGGSCVATVAGEVDAALPSDAAVADAGHPEISDAPPDALNVDAALDAPVVDGAVGDAEPVPPTLMVTPTSGAFGMVVLGSSSSVMFTVTNTGGLASGALAVSVKGTHAADFVPFNNECSGIPLIMGDSCMLGVRFSPGAVDVRSAFLEITWTSGPSFQIALSGEGLVPGTLRITPNEKIFAPTAVGSTASQSFTVENTGGAESGALSVDIIVNGSNNYTIQTNDCTGEVLSPGETCAVQARFEPEGAGDSTASLRVMATPGGTVTAALSGTAAATLSVTKSGNGHGSVISNPGGIACGATCSSLFSTSPIVLSAMADPESEFGGFSSGGCGGTGPCSVALTSAITTITATFVLKNYLLEVTKTGEGTVESTAPGIDCGDMCSASFESGTTVSLTQTAAVGFDFLGWSGACSGTGACSVTMSSMKSIGATFVREPVSLNVTITGGGDVTASDGSIDCPGDCDGLYDWESTVVLHAAPAAGYYFSGWTGDCSDWPTDCTLSLTSSTTVGAEFRVHPVQNGQSATVLIGQPTWSGTESNAGGLSATSLSRPVEIATDGSSRIWVHDCLNARVLSYGLPVGSPASASAAIGQPSLTVLDPNAPTQTSMSYCEFAGGGGVSYAAGKLWATDRENERALLWSPSPTNTSGVNAARVIGQTTFSTGGGGLTAATFDGDEGGGPYGIWTNGTKVIVADPNNHRVLIWNDVASNGEAADVVLGQPNFTTNAVADPPTSRSLRWPRRVYVSGSRLYVGDNFNHRVLVWNSIPTTSYAPADFVIGQADFATRGPNANQGSTVNPNGFGSDGAGGIVAWNNSLFVSDTSNGRVMVFSPIPSASHPAATRVLGGNNLATSYGMSSPSPTTHGRPYGLAVASGKLYVADWKFNRVVAFELAQ